MGEYEKNWAFVLLHYIIHPSTIMHCLLYMPMFTPILCFSILQMERESNAVKSNHSNCIDSFLYQILEK
jgi:hypothetical protein